MKNKKLTDSFNYAFEGILYALRKEKNIRIHVCLAFLILFASLFFPLTRVELILLFLAITLVIMAEMFNTAVETVVDAFVDYYHPLAKVAKDVAAGAVLITALNSLIVGYLLFSQETSPLALLVWQKIKSTPWHLTFFSLLVVLILVLALKAIYLKPGRVVLQGGMPSGHSALAFACATAVSFQSGNLFLALLALLLAALVAQSRIEGKIHTWEEVLVGAVLGIVVTGLIFQLLR